MSDCPLARFSLRAQLDIDLLDFACKREGYLVGFGHRRAGIEADVKGFVIGKHDRLRAFDSPFAHRLAVDKKFPYATGANSAIGCELKLQRDFSRRYCLIRGNYVPGAVGEVIDVRELAALNEQAIAPEPSTLGHQRSLRSTRWYDDARADAKRPVHNTRCAVLGQTDCTRIECEFRTARRITGLTREETHPQGSVVQGQNIIQRGLGKKHILEPIQFSRIIRREINCLTIILVEVV